MRTLYRALAVACFPAFVITAPSLASGSGTAQFTGWGPGQANGGGAFTFKLVADGSSHGNFHTTNWAGTHAEHGIGSSFVTFCLETGEEIYSIGDYYRASVDDTIAYGVQSSAYFNTAHGDVIPANHTTLERQTAFLYSGFRRGTLSGNVTGWTSATIAALSGREANALQAAIWLLQSQAGNYWIHHNGGYDSATLTLVDNLIAYANSAPAYWASLGDVRVMNLWSSDNQNNSTRRQSQLIMIPLPPETAMAGLGMAAIFGIGVVRRRRK